MRAVALFAILATQAFQERVDIHYIEVPVTVIGRDGAPVRGLSKANFEIRDDGQPRTIESFDAVDFAAADPRKAISPLHPASRRNFLLLFDLSYSNPNAIARAQQAARNFIARSIGGRDLVAVATVDVDRGFRFLTAFTTDRELLTAAIADPRSYRSTDPLQIAGAPTLDVPKGGTRVGERESIALENMQDVARLSGRIDDALQRTRVKKQVEMLGSVARALQKLAGRKHLVLLSEGFDPRLIEGRAAEEGEEAAEENRAVSAGEVWKVDSDKRFGSAGHQRDIALMADAFRRADVVLHAVDIQGVRVQNDLRGGSKFNSNAGLFLLANSTGGTVFQNSNDITSEFDKLTRQHEVVYILGFHAPAGRAGQFHDLSVKLVNAPAGARVQHRGGYYGAGAESTVERALTTAEIIVNDIAQEDVEIAALAAAFPIAERALVPVVLEIGGAGLVKAAKNDTATADVFIYAFDEDGIVRDSLHQRVVLDLAQVGQRLRDSGIRFYGTLHLPPGTYAVKSLVRVAESDTKGYRRVELTVPAHDDVAVVRPLFFDDAGNWVMVKAARDQTTTPYPFVVGGNPFIPAARATLRKGEPRLFALFVYNADPDEITVDVTPAATLVSQAASDEVTKFVYALERVPAGVDELHVAVRKKGSADERRVSVPIRAD
ncbi:MAG TPA: VWA domain-containing protein [Thermoanaerobaculia bacterium]|nr:VWA domain-containing protein [Thermoanaerobaculia bacterium]